MTEATPTTDVDVEPVESAGDPPTAQHVHLARLSFHPHLWTWLTDGELSDHRGWKTLVELFEPKADERGDAINAETGEVTPAGQQLPAGPGQKPDGTPLKPATAPAKE